MTKAEKNNSGRDRIRWVTAALAAASALGVMGPSQHAGAAADARAYVTLSQGWSDAERFAFYSQDQGSRIMPLAWMRALRTPEGEPFLADGLTRFGYLPNDRSPHPDLPVGFLAAEDHGTTMVGMTCAACHTRQITAQGKSYRIDGGPALANFQSFLTALDSAVAYALATPATFQSFAQSVLGAPDPGPDAVAALRAEVEAWYQGFSTLTSRALPNPEWGAGRLDAITMIFNRLNGLDIGPPPSYLIPDNIQPANAPVRYPFLWNALVQDKTQWPGFADNGDDVLGLARNLGEAMGVFGTFHPVKDDSRILGINYTVGSSFNFGGLLHLEQSLRTLNPPKWPGPLDAALATQGAAVFDQACASCHGIRPGTPRLLHTTWATPVQNVGTDTREWSILTRKVNPGVLTGAGLPGFKPPLSASEAPIDVLALAVLGTIIDRARDNTVGADAPSSRLLAAVASDGLNANGELLKGAFRTRDTGAAKPGSYESRVLRGIWAAAPYLHNGSVPTLADLLKPASQRPTSFKIGPAYDFNAVGLAQEQGGSATTLVTTDCSALDSGNSRCGHEFGVELSARDKRALLEYLKTDMR
ncbi:MAG TPA: di-heme-cytochrome C peroxidase [Burkholderiaceae bacterium]|jgi:cytochrome c5